MQIAKDRPCADCPFLKVNARSYGLARLQEFAAGAFPCHQTAEQNEQGGYVWGRRSKFCAGALIFNESRGEYTQAMQIAERMGDYEPGDLDMSADVI
jgi:hypothetical protein